MIKSTWLALTLLVLGACDFPLDSDEIQGQRQEHILQEGIAKVGMPNIVNFRELKTMKDIIELRDQEGYVTYTYTYSEVTGEYRFFCVSIGYPLPYATQFTNPEREEYAPNGSITLPQADPNGLYSPANAEGTWVMCKRPDSTDLGAVYVEPKLTTVPWPMPGVETPGVKKPSDTDSAENK